MKKLSTSALAALSLVLFVSASPAVAGPASPAPADATSPASAPASNLPVYIGLGFLCVGGIVAVRIMGRKAA